MADRAYWLPMDDLSLIEVVMCQLRAGADPSWAAAALAALSQLGANTRGCALERRPDQRLDGGCGSGPVA